MDENKELEQSPEEQGLITRIFDSLSQKIALIIAIVLAALVIGLIYDKVRTHSYVVNENVLYTAQNTAVLVKDENSGKYVIKENDTQHINAARKYFSTVSDFIDSAVVVKRAEFYYLQYKNFLNANILSNSSSSLSYYIDVISQKHFSNEMIEENGEKLFTLYFKDGTSIDNCSFIEITGEGKLKFNTGSGEEAFYRLDNTHTDDKDISYITYTYDTGIFPQYNSETFNKKTSNIVKSNISATTNSSEEDYILKISYKDRDIAEGMIKVRLVSLAANQELKMLKKGFTPVDGVPLEYNYFGTVAINLEDFGISGTEVDISTRKMVFIFGICGLALSFLVVYILSILDTTVSTKKDLEKLTGSTLFAYIEDVKKEKK